MPQYEYTLDTTGQLAANRIQNEEHTVTAVNHRNYHFIIPRFAPYHDGSLKVYLKETGGNLRVLQEGVDYAPAALYSGASLALAHSVYGAISFFDLNFSGTVLLEYQTLGGEYTLDLNRMTEVMANIVYNPRGVTWEEITGLATMFPPIDHPWDFKNMVGMDEVVNKLGDLTQAVLSQAGQSNEAHQRDFNNPHKVNKTQIELGLVENHPPATVSQGIEGLSNESNVTPLVLRAVLEQLGLLQISDTVQRFEDHLNNLNNPHENTAHSVGLGMVENIPVVSLSDILSRRPVRKVVTMDMMMEYLAKYGCKPLENQEIEHPPKGALLSTYCNNYNNMGVFAHGNGTTYEKVIELNSRDCGYQPPATTMHPKQGTVLYKFCRDYDQIALVADGFGHYVQHIAKLNSPDCGYKGDAIDHPKAGTVLATRCDNGDLVKTIANGSGGSTEEREPKSSQCQQSAPAGPPRGTLLSTYCEGTNMMGRYADGAGSSYTAVETRNSVDCGYKPPAPPPPVQTPPPPPPVKPPPPPPVAKVNIQVQVQGSNSISVGQNTKLNTSMTGLTAGKRYTMTWYKTNRTGSYQQYYDSHSFTASKSTDSVSFDVSNNGDVVSGAYRFKAEIREDGGQTRTSNEVTINYAANRSISLSMNGTSSQTSVEIGRNVSVNVDFRDFPITGSAARDQRISFYLEIRGGEHRDAGRGEYTFQTNSTGAFTWSFTNTLAGHPNVRGNTTYCIVAEWTDLDGNHQTTRSNTVTINWTGPGSGGSSGGYGGGSSGGGHSGGSGGGSKQVNVSYLTRFTTSNIVRASISQDSSNYVGMELPDLPSAANNSPSTAQIHYSGGVASMQNVGGRRFVSTRPFTASEFNSISLIRV